MQTEYDFACTDLGSIASLTALSAEADDWLAYYVDPEAPTDGSNFRTIYGEPRYMLDIALGMIGDGLTCEDSDKINGELFE